MSAGAPSHAPPRHCLNDAEPRLTDRYDAGRNALHGASFCRRDCQPSAKARNVSRHNRLSRKANSLISPIMPDSREPKLPFRKLLWHGMMGITLGVIFAGLLLRRVASRRFCRCSCWRVGTAWHSARGRVCFRYWRNTDRRIVSGGRVFLSFGTALQTVTVNHNHGDSDGR